MSRWRLACDVCDVASRIGVTGDGFTAWCEGCQRAVTTTAPPPPGTRCERCGQPLAGGAPRFEELYGRIQEIAAVVAAWDGDWALLARLLPERPRLLTDLSPPEPVTGDSPVVRDALHALGEGRWHSARERLEPLLATGATTAGEPRLWRALAIAAERLGDPERAESAWSRVLDLLPGDEPARLNRGALRARRGDHTAARDDFSRAGDGHEARWDRAATRVLESVATASGTPATTLAAARAEAPTPTDYWIEPTIGRLLFAALVERALAHAPGAGRDEDVRALRAAERELEFDTFWDRALVVLGYARLGLATETGVAARSLTAREMAVLRAEPAVAGPAGHALAGPLEAAARAIDAADPHAARTPLEALCARADLRRYRVPCAVCGRGSIGVEGVEEDGASDRGDPR
ncbi:MAG: tetratricopeptide repeat protein [Candidatus Eisenbacteria bacterium]